MTTDGGTSGDRGNRAQLFATFIGAIVLGMAGQAAYGPGGGFVGLLAFPVYFLATRRGESDAE